MTRRPPAEERRLGVAPVMRDWTRKAATISRQRRLDTRLGEISCRARVSVVKATSPDTDNPGEDKLQTCITTYHHNC